MALVSLPKFKRLLGYLRPYRGWMLLLALIMSATTLLSLPLVLTPQVLFDNILKARVGTEEGSLIQFGQSGPSDASPPLDSVPSKLPTSSRVQARIYLFVEGLISDYSAHEQLILLVILLFVAGVGAGGLSLIQSFLFYRVGNGIILDLRREIFGHLERLSLSFYARRQTGEIMSRVMNDVEALQGLLTSTILNIAKDLLTATVMVSFVVALDWKLSLLVGLTIPLHILNVKYFSPRIRKITRHRQARLADVSADLQESLAGIRLIQSFAREEHRLNTFSQRLRNLFSVSIKSGMIGAVQVQIATILSAIGSAVIILYGGYQVLNHQLMPGGLPTFVAALGMAIAPVLRLIQVNVQIQAAMASADRIFELLDEQSTVSDPPDGLGMPQDPLKISFRGVSFSYDGGGQVLQDMSFEVSEGMTVALVGPSGAGKSTVASLLCRFYDPTSGDIEINGESLRRYSLEALRESIGIVDQDTFLFTGSLFDNVRFGKDHATEEQIMAACRDAFIHDFISALPEGYASQVGERGVTLSGGEKQRLSIARAILKDPRILILDEATSSLDSSSEGLIQRALSRFMEEKTAIVIAHRLSTVQKADRILVLENGRLVEQGDYQSLLAQNGLFRRLHDEQFAAAGHIAGTDEG